MPLASSVRSYLAQRYRCDESNLICLANDPPYISIILMHRIITLAHKEITHEKLECYIAQELNQAIAMSRSCYLRDKE